MPQTSTRTAASGCLAGAPTAGTRSTRSRRRPGLRHRAPAPGGTAPVLVESCRSCPFGSFGFAGQVAHDVDVGAQRQAVPSLLLSLLDGRAVKLSLADVLDGLISRASRGQRARIQLRVRELPGERNFQALDIEESVRREELLTRTRPPERHHHSLVADLLRGSKPERRQRPGPRGHLQMTPHRYPDAPAGAKDPVYLGHRAG